MIFDVTTVRSRTKDGYKNAIIQCLKNIENNLDNVLDDIIKTPIEEIKFTIVCGYNEVSLINVNKKYLCKGEKNENN